jgi:predicted ATPase
MIDKIILKNFKCYEEQPFLFKSLTVFCGNNSVGKSTAIQSLLLALQNNFSSKLELTGDYISPGTYDDIHNRDAEEDGLSILLDTSVGSISWGYREAEFSDAKRREVEEAPLPLLDDSSTTVRHALRELYQNDFNYLSAERLGPRDYSPYSTKRRSQNWLGTGGEFTSQVLEMFTKNIQGIQQSDPRTHVNLESKSVNSRAENLFEWMNEISPGVFIKAKSEKKMNIANTEFQVSGHSYRAVNVGFGLSYSLPVVLSLLMAERGGLVIIENPEAHLHPRGQSYLGRLIALSAEAGVQVIVETHSDHVMNGIRLMPRLGKVDPTNIIYYQITDKLGADKVKTITVNSQGQFSEWPEGFFDQQVVDMKILLSGSE